MTSHFVILGIDFDDAHAVTLLNSRKMGSDADHMARTQLRSCQGPIYFDLTDQCIMGKKPDTRRLQVRRDQALLKVFGELKRILHQRANLAS